MENVHVGSHGNSHEDLNSSQECKFAIDVTMKQKIDMNRTDTFGMDMKKIRMLMYSASFVMENLQTYQI